MILPAMLGLDSHVHQLGSITQEIPVVVCGLRLVRDNTNNSGKFSDTYLPDMKISHQRITIALHRAASRIREIGRSGCTIEQDATGIADQSVRPRYNNGAA